MNGRLFVYDSEKKLVGFESGKANADLCFILIGGLTDGLLSLPFANALSDYVTSTSARLVQILLSSSYHGFGHSSLAKDAIELSLCIKYLLNQSNKTSFVLIGHSTGCQIAVYYLNNCWKKEDNVIGCILQAGVSDREYFNSVLPQNDFLDLSQSMIQNGKAEEMMPRQADLVKGAPITAYRYFSLMAIHGEDDFFSFDLDFEYQKQFFSGYVPITVVLSGQDEYVPKFIPVMTLASKYKYFDQVKLIEVIENADHAISNDKDQEIFIEFVKKSLSCFLLINPGN